MTTARRSKPALEHGYRCAFVMVCAAASVVLVAAGCGTASRTNEPDTVSFSGEVSLDGKPLPSGQFVLLELESTPARTFVADVIEGRFRGRATSGPKRVEIRAFREDVSTSLAGSPGDVDPQYLPARFNGQSELTADISPEGNTELKFELTSQ